MERAIKREKQILMLHSQLIEQTGGTAGVRGSILGRANTGDYLKFHLSYIEL